MTIPNLLTLLRFILIIPFSYFLVQGDIVSVFISLVIYCVASVTDYVDGFLARKLNQTTEAGAFLDPLADKILVLSAFFIFSFKHYLNIHWIFVLFLAFREYFITFLRIEIKFQTKIRKTDSSAGKKALKTSFLAKLKTTIQMFTIIVFYALYFLKIKYGFSSPVFTTVIPYVLFALCLYFAYSSGIEYIKKHPGDSLYTLLKTFSSVFYTGYFPKAPGSFSTLIFYLLLFGIYLIFPFSSPTLFYSSMRLPLTLILFTSSLLTVLIGNHSIKLYNHKDPSGFTLDEIAGGSIPLLVLSFFPGTGFPLLMPVLSYLFFRFFDIAKPFGIKKIQNIPGGLGILADDLLAGLYSGILILLLQFIF